MKKNSVLRLLSLGFLLAVGSACSSPEPVSTTSTTTTRSTAVEPVAPIGGTSSTTTTVLGGGR